jgi:hypothetical protein
MMMNRRAFSTALLAGAAASLVSSRGFAAPASRAVEKARLFIIMTRTRMGGLAMRADLRRADNHSYAGNRARLRAASLRVRRSRIVEEAGTTTIVHVRRGEIVEASFRSSISPGATPLPNPPPQGGSEPDWCAHLTWRESLHVRFVRDVPAGGFPPPLRGRVRERGTACSVARRNPAKPPVQQPIRSLAVPFPATCSRPFQRDSY